MNQDHPKIPKPPWLRVRLPSGETYAHLKKLMRDKSLHTVCEGALCPNIAECWEHGTATFMILGNTCTRNCRFCSVNSKDFSDSSSDWEEPTRVAEAVASMKLRHVVVTSVTRDDLEDGGAAIFAETIRQIHTHAPGCTVEVLIPDFKEDRSALNRVTDAQPEILGHNVETVPRLYAQARPQAGYRRSLKVLQMAKESDPDVLTKSGVMVGLGETWDELLEVMNDLRQVSCDILTIGQYLRPTKAQLPVVRYYTPEEFSTLEDAGYERGFRWVESGPLVRSSYHAERQSRMLLHLDSPPRTQRKRQSFFFKTLRPLR